jgi:hypothetical protein
MPEPSYQANYDVPETRAGDDKRHLATVYVMVEYT